MRTALMFAPTLLLGLALTPVQGAADRSAARGNTTARQPCSVEALPAADRRQMEREYQQRMRTDGKPSADAWVREQGRQFRLQLIEQGVCEDPDNARQVEARGEAAEEVRGKDGKRCSHMRMEPRTVASLSGGAMTMIMVPVCAD